MIRTGLLISLVAALAACSSGPNPARSLNDPVVQRLFALPTAEMYGTMRASQRIAAACSAYRYDAALEQVLNERRVASEGQVAVLRARDGIPLYADVLSREFQARHNAVIGQDDVCPGADAEYAAGSALSAALVPVR